MTIYHQYRTKILIDRIMLKAAAPKFQPQYDEKARHRTSRDQ